MVRVVLGSGEGGHRPNCLPTWPLPFCTPPQRMSPCGSTPSPPFGVVSVLDFGHSHRHAMVSRFILHVPDDIRWGASFHVFVICTPSSVKCLLKSLAHLVCFFKNKHKRWLGSSRSLAQSLRNTTATTELAGGMNWRLLTELKSNLGSMRGESSHALGPKLTLRKVLKIWLLFTGKFVPGSQPFHKYSHFGPLELEAIYFLIIIMELQHR